MLTNFIRNSTLVSTEFMSDRWADSWIIVYMGAFLPMVLHRFYILPGWARAYRAAIPSHEHVCSIIHVRVSLDQHFWQPCHLSVEESCGRLGFVQTQGFESTVIGILQRFPFSMASLFFFIVTMISFVTLVDPMTSVLATISTKVFPLKKKLLNSQGPLGRQYGQCCAGRHYIVWYFSTQGHVRIRRGC